MVILGGCTSLNGLSSQPTYVNLLPPRGELPAFSAPIPSGFTVRRGFASARVAGDGFVIDFANLLESRQIGCEGSQSCTSGSTTVDGRAGNFIRYRTHGSYPYGLQLSVPFRDKSFYATVSCLTARDCDTAQRLIERGVFAEIAMSR